MDNLKDIILADRDQMAFDPTEFGEVIEIDGVPVPGIVVKEWTQTADMPTDWVGEDDGGHSGVAGRMIEIKIKAGVINVQAEQRRRINSLEYWISAVKRGRHSGMLTVTGFWGV